MLSSLLYVAMLVLVPLGWDGYSSASRTVSELSAIGAPTRSRWVALGSVWALLYAAFGAGVRTAAGPSRTLRTAGRLVIAAAALSLVWPPMHQREVLAAGGATLTDTLHLAWTALNGVLTLAAMGFAAAAFNRRFRLYSAATMAILLAAGALTSLDASRIQADLPTPWAGAWERVNIGAWLLWVAVLAITLLSRAHAAPAPRPTGGRGREAPKGRAPMKTSTPIHGLVAPGFEEVRAAFERNFVERREIGAAVAAYWRGEKVVDLWGGRRTPDGDAPWNEDTMVVVMSTTKGLSAMTLALANARGWLDYDAPVARYWPEFGQRGKGGVTVRQLLAHEAGLVLLDETLTIERLRDLDGLARLLARQTPAWPPGTRRGYHTMTVGLYMQELVRRVDPGHRSLGRFFREEIAAPLGLEFHIGLPPEIPDGRLARVKTLSPWRGILALRYTPPAVTLKMLAPGSLLRRTFVGVGADPNDRRYLAVEVPAGNGVGTARGIARAYAAFAEGGGELGLTPETFARLTALPEERGKDVVLGVPSYFSLGFLRPGPTVWFGSSPRAFGAPGAGGSFGFADRDLGLGYAYVMNRLDFHLTDDPREKALRDAVYRAIARASGRTRAAGAGLPPVAETQPAPA